MNINRLIHVFTLAAVLSAISVMLAANKADVHTTSKFEGRKPTPEWRFTRPRTAGASCA